MTAPDHTRTARLVLLGDYVLYREVVARARMATWNNETRKWENVDTAAAALREFAEQIPTDIPGFGDLESVDMDEVDWVSMIREELESFDYESGRA